MTAPAVVPAALLTRLAVVALGATVLITWDLWAARAVPPNLPALDVAGWSGWGWGPALLAVGAYALWRPSSGAPLLAVAVAGACLADQLRLQPEVVSLALLAALLPAGPNARAVARWLLAATWLWAGLHKALSLGWSDEGAAFIADALHQPGRTDVVAWALPAAEIALGVLAFVPRAWPAVRWGALALHLGIVVTLSPLFADWNTAVWPWNLALAAVAFGLFRPEPAARTRAGLGVDRSDPAGADADAVGADPALAAATGAPATAMWPASPAGVVAGAVLLLAPALFYVGGMDAYLAHNLYSSNTARAVVCDPELGCVDAFDTWDELDVPFPPEPRLYRRWFRDGCRPGQELVVSGIRTRFTDPPTVDRLDCPRS